MLRGGGMVFFWKLIVRPLGGALDIYVLLPTFIFSSVTIVLVSLLTEPPSKMIQAAFDEIKAGKTVN